MKGLPEVGNYCVVKLDNKKNVFVKVDSVSEKKNLVKATVCHTVLFEEPETVTVEPKRILVNFPGRVPYGKVYNCTTEYLRDSEEVPTWGTLNYFRKVEKEDKKILREVLEKTLAKLEKEGLTLVLPIQIDVKTNSSAKVGLFKYKAKGRNSDVIVLMPFEFETDHLYSIITHEYGHGLWHRMMPAKIRSKWIDRYHIYVQLSQITPKLLKQIREQLENCESIKEFYSIWEKDTDTPIKDIMSEIFKYISKVHHISKLDVETLVKGRMSLESYWPVSLDLTNIKQVLTDYSRKSPQEFFCEAFMLYMQKKKLPKKIDKLMKLTLSKTDRLQENEE